MSKLHVTNTYVRKIHGKYRVVISDRNNPIIAQTKNKVAIDGGGHMDKEKALRQSRHINDSRRY